MNSIKSDIKQTRNAFDIAIQQVKTSEELEKVRTAFLGRHGKMSSLTDQLKQLSVDEKRLYGPLVQELKTYIQETYDKIEKQLKNKAYQLQLRIYETFDVTAYKKQLYGSLHIYTQLIDQLTTIFITMGYALADGPEVETEYYNFTALNIPPDHPAREMQDTFWLMQPNLLLRTHTSPIQVRAMETRTLPLAIFAPGRVYRNEATDASHDFMFMQTEGILIDKQISMAHLLATAKSFLQAVFETKDLNIRVRPGYFPFVEPGVEIDISCPFCKTGCSICKKTSWIELLGSGLIHPNVLRMSGINPEEYSGFAFGLGLERLAMIKYGINDIRLFHSNKLQFLKQF